LVPVESGNREKEKTNNGERKKRESTQLGGGKKGQAKKTQYEMRK